MRWSLSSAFLDGKGAGWLALGEPYFITVNGPPGHLEQKYGVLSCTR
jgi:hypothetical protein